MSLKAGWPANVMDLVQLWMLVQGLVTGGFFGFNFGEHWAKAKSVTNNSTASG